MTIEEIPSYNNCIIVNTSINTLYLLNDVLQYWPIYLKEVFFIVRLNDGEEKKLPQQIELITQKFSWLSAQKIIEPQEIAGGKIYFAEKQQAVLSINNNIIGFKHQFTESNYCTNAVQLFLSNNMGDWGLRESTCQYFNIALVEKSLIPQQYNTTIDIHLNTWQVADYISRFTAHWNYLKPYLQNETNWQQTVLSLLNDLGESKSGIQLSVNQLFDIAKRMTILKKSSLPDYLYLLQNNIAEYQRLTQIQGSNIQQQAIVQAEKPEMPLVNEAYLLTQPLHSLFIVDKNYCILYFNDNAANEVLKIKNKSLKRGDSLIDLITPTDIDWFIKDFEKASQGLVVNKEKLVRDKQGNEYFFYYNYVPIKSDTNEVDSVCISIINVTQQRQILSKIIAQEHIFATILHNALSGLLLYDDNEGIIEVNEAALKQFGYTKQELLHKKRDVIIEYSDAFLKLLKQRNENGNVRGEAVGIKKDGTHFPIEFSSVIVNDAYNQKKYYCSVINDITERRNAELQTKKTNDQLESLISNLKTAVVVHNADTSISLSNKEAEILLGLTNAQMLGKEAIDPAWCFRHEDGTPMRLEDYPVNKVIAAKSAIKDYIVIIERPATNDSVWVLANAFPELDEHGHIIRVVVTFIDVTTIKTTEKLLTEVTNMAKIGAWEVNLINNTVTWNDITKEIHELNTTTNITLTDAINFYKEGEHRSHVEQKVIEAISNGMAFDFEAIIVTAKGHERWVRATGKPEFIQNKCVRLFGVIQDIHDNKLAEIQLLEANKAITQSNERFEYVTKATFDAIWDWDLETNTFFRGEGFETLFGNRYKEQLNSKISWNVIHPEDQARVEASIQKACDEGSSTWQAEYRFLKSDNTYAFVVDKAVIIRNQEGKAIRMIGAMHDISKIKIEEEQRRLLESVVTNANDMIVITEAEPFDVPGPRIVYVNEAFLKHTGYTKEEVIGKTPRLLQGPKTDKRVLSYLKERLQQWLPTTVELINYKKNHEEFWNEFTVIPVANERGWYTHWIAIERDITERKKNELEKEQLIAELSKTNNELKQFSYITSHNLRAPLTNLLAIFSILDTSQIKDAPTVELIDALYKSTNQLNDTLNELIKVLIIKENTNKQLTNISFADVLEQVKQSIGALIHNANCVIIDNFKDAPTVDFDKTYLESIVLNLITNAIKYAHPDRSPVIYITSAKTNKGVQLSVADNGIGFNMQKVKNKIFGLYQRFHNHPDSKGFGLYLVHAQVTSLGGNINVHSVENEGTRFVIDFNR